MLKDESLQYIEEQFLTKAMLLEQYGQKVSATEMYKDIFQDMDVVLPVVIIDEELEVEETNPSKIVEKHIVPMRLEEALAQSTYRNDMLLGGCTYFNNWISKRSAKDIYALVIDMDNVFSGTLEQALANDWNSVNDEFIAKPTYLVNSGTGCHAYFVLNEKIPNYRQSTEKLDRLYRALAVQQTTKRVYLKQEVQWFGQGFRIAGGLNKYKWENQAYKIGDKWDIDDLARAVGMDVHFIRYGEKRTEKPVSKQKFKRTGKGWHTSRAFYDYTLRTCRDKTKEGNRYTSLCALSVIAWKCGVSFEELEQDLKELLPIFNKDARRVVKEREIYSALKMYNEKAMLTQRQSLEHWQGWEYTPIRRNGRKRDQHLKLARGIKDLKKQMGEDIKEGRPKGESKEKYIVLEWRKNNPAGRKVDCIRATGLAKSTVYRWWNYGEDN